MTEQDLAHRRAFQSSTGAGIFDRGGTDARFHMGTTVTVSGGEGDLHEKMLDRYAMPVNRVELSVHGDEMLEESRSLQKSQNQGLL